MYFGKAGLFLYPVCLGVCLSVRISLILSKTELNFWLMLLNIHLRTFKPLELFWGFQTSSAITILVINCHVKSTPKLSDLKQWQSCSCFALFCFCPQTCNLDRALCRQFVSVPCGVSWGSSSRGWKIHLNHGSDTWPASWCWPLAGGLSCSPRGPLHGWLDFKSKCPKRQRVEAASFLRPGPPEVTYHRFYRVTLVKQSIHPDLSRSDLEPTS